MRKRCYYEKILRGQYGKHPGYDRGWTKADQALYDTTNLSPSFCDKRRYTRPEEPTCDKIGRYPIRPKGVEESVFSRLARLEVVARQPERQHQVFGWVTPAKNDFVAQTAFEMAKARYWAGPDPNVPPIVASFGESLEQVYSFHDTADFHANYLLRLLYLYGDTPPHLRTHRAAWRRIGHFDRDINFSAQAETQIRNNLLAFKYWLDESFFADAAADDARCLRQWRANRAAQGDNSYSTVPEDDKNNAEMTYWSENHQILFATAEYLAGQLWPETIFRVGNQFRKEGQDKTRPTDLLGRQRMERAKPRILRWLNDRLRFGFSEWNSSDYYEEDFTALLNLADFSLDDEIQTRACMVLDLLIFDLARLTQNGSFSATAGRCYFAQKNCGYDQAVGDLIEVLFGTRGVIVEQSSRCAGSLASSRRYPVPDVLMAIGQDKPTESIDRSRVSINFDEAASYDVGFDSDEDVMFWWSRGAFFTKQLIVASLERAGRYHLMKTSPFVDVFPKMILAATLLSHTPAPDPAKVAEHLGTFVGIIQFDPDELVKLADEASPLTEGSALTRANLYTYRSSNAMLSSVQNFRPGQISFQVQACQATLSLDASVWTTYPSAGAPFKIMSATGDGPNWWTGSATAPRVTQRKNAAIIAYKPKELQFLLFGHRTHAWFPKAAFDHGSVIQRDANCNIDGSMWTFGQVGDGYVGLFSAQAAEWTTTGPWADKELVADGLRNFFIIQVGSKADFKSYANFVSQVGQARIHIGGLHLVTGGEVAGAARRAATRAVAGVGGSAAAAGPLGAVVGGVGRAVDRAIVRAEHTSENFECSYDIPGADRLELHYDDNEVLYAGRQFSGDHFPRFESPYIKCGRVEWGRNLYTIKHSQYSLTHDLRGIKDIGKPPARVRRLVDSAEKDEDDCSYGPRPFYVVGHNPNSIEDVIAALNAGANAIEPDVNVYEDRQGELCISEAGTLDKDEGGNSDAPSLAQFLDDLHRVALNRPELALVVFDCKPKVATPEHGATLLKEIRDRLTHDTQLNVIISVSSLDHTAIFDNIKGKLCPREGVMIDEENDPIAVSNFFTQAGMTNQCFGNGVASVFSSPTLSPHVRPSMEQACEIRAELGRIKFIYVWSLAGWDLDGMREYIRIGVDGIIAGALPSTFEPASVAVLRGIIDEDEFQSVIRLARREDNPLTPPNSAYGLIVHTGDKHNAGTDAMLTFTLTGTLGSSTKTVDASLIGSISGKTPGRMERNAWDYIALQSPDLGELKSITVQRDDQGNAPDWFLDLIIVSSFHYRVSKKAVFNRWIETTPTTLALE